ncbi:MAG: PfkB family carbohydrate kinase, partial [Terriglobales bacterium]
IWTTRSFDVYEGGGEYNVARGMKRCFGLDSAVVTALADNPIGRLVQDLIYQGGVDQTLIKWVDYDSVGRTVRNGLNFTERGFGVRPALGCSDRGHTAISQTKPGDFDWERIFGDYGARWFHTGGIFCALSETTPEVAIEALQAARKHGVVTSYDLNYRESLWKAIGGKKRAQEVNRRIAPYIDVMIGNEEDFSAALGYEVAGLDEHHSKLDVETFKKMIATVVKDFPFKVVATTLRVASTATRNDWGAVCYANGQYYQAMTRSEVEIYDRVGGGDSFASGLIYGFLSGQPPLWAVECGAAHGALAMTTPGDTTMVTLKEVLQVMKGVGARIAR